MGRLRVNEGDIHRMLNVLTRSHLIPLPYALVARGLLIPCVAPDIVADSCFRAISRTREWERVCLEAGAHIGRELGHCPAFRDVPCLQRNEWEPACACVCACVHSAAVTKAPISLSRRKPL